MKSILVASDLSERSDRAVRRAIRLAREHGATCHVLHVIDQELPADLASRWREDAGTRLARFIEGLDTEGVEVSHEERVGDLLVAIPELVSDRDVDLVVLGLHRRRAFLDRLRETTMERLVRLLRKPVLLVREPAGHSYETVLAPVSFSPACTAACRAARAVAPKARLHAFHSIPMPYSGLTGEKSGGAMSRALIAEAEAVRADWLAQDGPDLTPEQIELETGPLREVMASQLAKVRPDLIAIGAHTRFALAPHLLGSFAAELVRDAPADLLIACSRA
jgi:nucleotide-binding universal stress UspA family protein